LRYFGPIPGHVKYLHAHDKPLPEFPALQHVHESRALPGHNLEPHLHPQFEICYIHSGKGIWFAEGHTYELKPGDIYITKPGEVHGGRTDPKDPYHLFALALDVAALPLGPMFGKRTKTLTTGNRDVADAIEEAGTMHDHFNALDQRVIPGGAGLEQIFGRLLNELDAPVRPGKKARMLQVMMVQALLVELLVFVARCASAHAEKRLPDGATQTPNRPKFQELLKLIRSRISDPPGLSEMAKFVDLSPAHLTLAFKRETGLTPLELVTRIRIDAAAARLTQEPRVAITDVALDLGFSSAQYFSIVFRKHKGCTPTGWRRKGLGKL
jgi:AraC family L-rhamnose operon regulatory protein RhaS